MRAASQHYEIKVWVMNICMLTSVSGEDSAWVPQYLNEVERLGIDFVIHLDRCDKRMSDLFTTHKSCAGHTKGDGREFNETHKNKPMALVVRLGYDLAFATDIDETYDKDAPSKLKSLPRSGLTSTYWINLWGDIKHIRVDGPFALKPRDKLYDLKNHSWKYRSPVINGPYPHPDTTSVRSDIVCLHHGFMTRELRLMHKARWDRIYTKARGKNPYGIWNYATDEVTYPPTIEDNPYL